MATVEAICEDAEGFGCCCCIQCLQRRGCALEAAIVALSSEKLDQPCRDRLLKLVRGELNFVSKLTLQPEKSGTVSSHLEAVVRVLQYPLVKRACALMQMLPAAPEDSLYPPCDIAPQVDRKGAAVSHVDVVCYFNRKPAWVMVSARNPKHLSWFDEDELKKGLRSRILLLLSAAYLNPVIRPALVVLVFARGVEDEVRKKLEEGFAAKRMDVYDHIEIASEVRSAGFLERISNNSEPFCQGETLFEFEDGEWVIVQTEKIFASRELGTLSEAGNNYQVESQGWCPTAGKYISLEKRSPLIMFEIEVDRCIENLNLEEGPFLQHLDETCRHLMSTRRVVQDRHPDRYCERKGSQTDLGPGICGCNLSEYALNQGYRGLPEFFSQLNLQEEEISTLRNLELVNLDTTVLIGVISELSNGGARSYSEMSLKEMEVHFGSLSNFVKEQALLELQKPFLLEVESIFRKKRPIVSRYAWDEFWSIVSVIGGPHERRRAFDLSRALRHAIIPNSPSSRLMALPETKKIKEKHKIVFGTGDHLYTSTLTSNVTFVRAAVQKGMAFAVINHRPLALTGD